MKVKEEFFGTLSFTTIYTQVSNAKLVRQVTCATLYFELRSLDTKVKPYKIIVFNIEFG